MNVKMKGEIINMNEDKIKRFGALTMMNIAIDEICSYVMICEKDKYNENIVLSIDELTIIDLLREFSFDFIKIIEMDNYTLYSGFDTIRLSFDFGMISIERKDFNEFIKYLNELNIRSHV